MFERLKKWLEPPPETSDVLSVTIIRQGPDGPIEFKLTGKEASRWGYLLAVTRGTDPRYNELLPYWERTKL